MKRFILAGLLVAISASMALSAPRKGINMPDELRTKISADVAKQQAVTPISKWKRGSKIEDNAVLLDVPGTWGKDLTKYKYIYTENRVWFIDPTSRKAVDVIKVTR